MLLLLLLLLAALGLGERLVLLLAVAWRRAGSVTLQHMINQASTPKEGAK